MTLEEILIKNLKAWAAMPLNLDEIKTTSDLKCYRLGNEAARQFVLELINQYERNKQDETDNY